MPAANANGTAQTFNNNYSAFRTWLLGVTATKHGLHALSAVGSVGAGRCLQGVNGGDFDVNCSGLTINELMSIANTSLQNFGSTANGNTQRPVQEMYKSCIHAINNGGPVVPATPCDRTNTTYTLSCQQ